MVGLGEKLKLLRREKNLTQLFVANKIGVSKAMVSSYELSSRLPSYEVLVRLATFYSVSTDYLLGMETKRRIGVEGLTDKEIGLIADVVEALRNK